MTRSKWILALLAVFVLIQFVPVDKTNPPLDPSKDVKAVAHVPDQIYPLLKSACYDCHSNETKYPAYFSVAPVSWWLKNHINEGRGELNFSEFGTYKAKRKAHKWEECIELVEKGEMPLKSYTYFGLHPEAKMSTAERGTMVNWFKVALEMAKAEAASATD